MGYYMKVRGQPFFLARGKMVERKTQATWYRSVYEAETMLLRWEPAHKQRLDIYRWDNDERIFRDDTNYVPQPARQRVRTRS